MPLVVLMQGLQIQGEIFPVVLAMLLIQAPQIQGEILLVVLMQVVALLVQVLRIQEEILPVVLMQVLRIQEEILPVVLVMLLMQAVALRHQTYNPLKLRLNRKTFTLVTTQLNRLLQFCLMLSFKFDRRRVNTLFWQPTT
jgi:hypothetical protein